MKGNIRIHTWQSIGSLVRPLMLLLCVVMVLFCFVGCDLELATVPDEEYGPGLISGIWRWNDVLYMMNAPGAGNSSRPSFVIVPVNFTVNGVDYGVVRYGQTTDAPLSVLGGNVLYGTEEAYEMVFSGNTTVLSSSWASDAYKTLNFGPEEQKTDCRFCAWFMENATPVFANYTVCHYQKDVNGHYPSVPTETEVYSGHAGTYVTPEAKNYEGHVAPEAQTVVIAEDGSTVVNYYYS